MSQITVKAEVTFFTKGRNGPETFEPVVEVTTYPASPGEPDSAFSVVSVGHRVNDITIWDARWHCSLGGADRLLQAMSTAHFRRPPR